MVLGRLGGCGAGAGREGVLGTADPPGETGLLLLLVLECELGPLDEDDRLLLYPGDDEDLEPDEDERELDERE